MSIPLLRSSDRATQTGARAASSRRRLDTKTLSALIKLLVFMVVTALATSVLAIIIGNLSFGSTQDLPGGVRRRDGTGQG